MSQTKKNRKTILLGALVVVIIIGICFVCVTLYAKNEINKPKFSIPEQEETLLTDELKNKDEVFSYAMHLYKESAGDENTEGRWRTDVRRLDEDWETPFSKADYAILSGIRNKAGDQLKGMYPSQGGYIPLRAAENIPAFTKQASDVLDYSFTLGRENDKKEIVDDDRYFLTLTVDPNSEDTNAMLNSETYRKIAEELSPIASLSDTQIEMQSMTMCFTIDRFSEELLSVETRRDMLVTTTIVLTDESAALLEQKEGKIVLPYGTTQTIEFMHYGAHFSEYAFVVKPGDIKALPVVVNVNADASKGDDFTLTFTSSDPDALSFDEDGSMTVAKGKHDEPVTVTMTLEYNGQIYTDDLTVYITELEVEEDVGA